MSQDIPSSRKEKKALRDAERHRKGKKRKHAETGESEVQGDGSQEKADVEKDFISLDTDSAPVEGAVKAKKSKKRKHVEEDVVDEAAQVAPSEADKPKKKRKREDQEDSTGNAEEVADTVPDQKKKKRRRKAAKAGDATANGQETTETEPSQKHRFILFIGNLPFNTTDAALQAHFKKLSHFTLRHRTDPKTKKSKGFAFLEFENYDRMETCLKLYHHSMFDPADYVTDGKGQNKGSRAKSKGGRRINVELTAGGGGKNAGRMEKIKEKNVRLEEERKRRSDMEREEKVRSETKERPKKSSQAQVKDAPEDVDTAGMHPSRLARLTG